MSELMGLQAIQTAMTISDVLFECPSIEPIGESHPPERQWLTTSALERAGEQVGASVTPLCPCIFLLCLDNGNDGFIDQGDYMFLLELHLVKFQIPIMFVITHEAIQREREEFA